MRGVLSATIGIIVLAVAFLAVPACSAADEATLQDTSAAPPSQQTLSAEQRGDVLMARQQYLAAIDAYRNAGGDSAVIWNKTGIAYHHLFAMDAAKMDYQRALRLKPNYPEALNNLGAVFYAEKDYKKAEKLYRRSLKLMPHSATVYNNLGSAYFAQGNFKRGNAAYRAAFAIDPATFSGDPLQMVPDSSSSKERARQNYCLAKLFAQAGMKDRAIEHLRKALDEGFSDKKDLMQGREFAGLRNTAEFAQLMAEEKIQ
jgi:tetratricopeptide (TPR) repeat protein